MGEVQRVSCVQEELHDNTLVRASNTPSILPHVRASSGPFDALEPVNRPDRFLYSQGVVECRSLSFDKFHGLFHCRMELRAHRHVVMPMHLLHNDYLVFGDPMHVCFLSAPTIVKPLGKASLSESQVS